MGILFRMIYNAKTGTHTQEAAVVPWNRDGFERGRTTWDLSFPVKALDSGAQIDWFVSHSWKAAWWKRALGLMWICHALIAAVVSCAAALVATLCLVFWHDWTGNIWDDFVGFLPLGCGLVASMSFLFVLILTQGHNFICSTRRQSFFFDRCCIHQTDERKKVRGIMAIGRFLKFSKGMVVLWDPTYFTRMWCVFELATFAMAHSGIRASDNTKAGQKGSLNVDLMVKEMKRRIRIVPLHFVIHRLTSLTVIFLMSCVLCAAHFCGLRQHFELVTIALFLTIHVLSALVVSAHERSMHKESRRQLETFDIRNATVTFESDREFILDHVRALWGDEDTFNHFVRHEFLEHVVTHSGALSCGSSVVALRFFRIHMLPGVALCFGALAATVVAAPLAAYIVAVRVLG
jgi:hypothetical protein